LSGFETETFHTDAQDSFDEMLDSFLARDVTLYEKKIYTPGVQMRAIIQNVTSDTPSHTNLRQILCRIGTLRCGQYVKSGVHTWLVCTLPDENGIYEKAVMWFCKHTIRFVSPLTGTTVAYPVYSVNSAQYGAGETTKPMISIGAAQRILYIPYNEETICLDTGFRFVLDKNKENPTTYRLTQVDSESYSCGDDDGLLQWSAIQDQSRDVDDTVEMVADNTATEARKGSW
jgi:hypothetical protein